MGKGDRRTRRGKIFRGTFGVCRPQKRTKNVAKSEKVDIAINRGKIFRGTFGVCRPQKRTKNVAKSEKVDIAINTEKEETKD